LFRKLYVRAEALTPESEEVCLRQRRGGHENRYACDFFGAEVVRFVGDRFLKSIRYSSLSDTGTVCCWAKRGVACAGRFYMGLRVMTTAESTWT
jgi:hypothetical protein